MKQEAKSDQNGWLLEIPVVLEGCVTSLAESVHAVAGGAQRLELCSRLDVGGLTPSCALTAEVCEAVDVPVGVMIRPNPGSFHVDLLDVSQMLKEIEIHGRLGVQGFVFGTLNHADSIDERALCELVAASSGLPVTFHKAFDLLDDPIRGLEVLVAAGIKRVLSAGGSGTAWEGRRSLRELVGASNNIIEIVGAGSIRGDHVAALVEETGLRVVHARGEAIPRIKKSLLI